MINVKLHNLRCFIKWNPEATVADYAKEIREDREKLKLTGRAYERSRHTK